MRRNLITLLSMTAAALAVALVVGCSAAPGPAGPAGSQGPAGLAGAPGVPGKSAPAAPGAGLKAEISKVEIGADNKPAVTFKVTDAQGNLMKNSDLDANSFRFVISKVNTDKDSGLTSYASYITRTVTGGTYTWYTQTLQSALPSAVQATTDSGGKLTATDTGFTYVFSSTIPADYDKSATTVVGMQTSRDNRATAANATFAFVPAGGTPVVRQLVKIDTCNQCHGHLTAHGARVDASYCVLCHSPQTTDVQSGNIVDFKVMVHKIHDGKDLPSVVAGKPYFIGSSSSDFSSVGFPADILNCTTCHQPGTPNADNWKTKPSRAACGSCHDNIWFGDVASVPKGSVAHKGGPQANDSTCAGCHPPDTGGAKSVTEAHDSAVDREYDQVALSLSAPKNGKFYVAGEKPVVTIVIKDSKGNPIDHTKVDTINSTANLYVYGPRENSKPVLTLAAKTGISLSKASATNTIAASGTPKGWTFAAGDTFKVAVSPGAVQVLTAPAGLQTPTQVAAWLGASLPTATVTGNETAGTVNILSNTAGAGSRIEIYNSPVTTKLGWKSGPLDIIENGVVVGKTAGTTMEPYVVIGTLSTVADNLRTTNNPAIKRSADSITYQLDDVAGLKPGTYMVDMYTNLATGKTQNGWPRSAFGFTTFQVGAETVEPKVAENCEKCHGNTVMHLNESHVHPATFANAPDACKACHDYDRPGTGEGYSSTGGTSTNGWAGYGAKPISARVHGVHMGANLAHPEEVYAGNPNLASEIVFPQDIGNCTVCHDSKTSGTWKTEPSRLACLSCHDSDAAKAHGMAMTQLPTPDYDPYGPLAVETCKVCHGAGRDFSADKVHNIPKP
jgi:hypothetical protein